VGATGFAIGEKRVARREENRLGLSSARLRHILHVLLDYPYPLAAMARLTLLREADYPDYSSIVDGVAFGIFLLLLAVCLCVWSFKQMRQGEAPSKRALLVFFIALIIPLAGAPYIYLAAIFLLG
jgi:multisubunit Na+/H+ antiporter MnhG subunit